jgi:hypothetical protein
MSATAATTPPRFIENSLLFASGILVHAPLHYQVPRWLSGLDPTFVHQKMFAISSFPFVLQMAQIHPIVWLSLTSLIFWKICRNYGWRLER